MRQTGKKTDAFYISTPISFNTFNYLMCARCDEAKKISRNLACGSPSYIYSSQNCEVTRLFEKNASPELKQVFRAKLLLLQMFFKKQKQVTRKKNHCFVSNQSAKCTSSHIPHSNLEKGQSFHLKKNCPE